MPSVKQKPLSWWLDSLFLIIFLGSLFFILLGTRPLFVPDEGRYAEIAREMVASGNYITPYLNGIEYFEKPALFYWLAAAAIKLGGLNLWSLRSVNALLGLLGCLGTYFTARSLYNRQTGLFAALILGTSALYFAGVHLVSLDLPVTVFLSLTLYCFLLGFKQTASNLRRNFFWAASLFAGLAVLSKGLIGILFPVAIISLWLSLIHGWRQIKHFYLPSCLLIFLLITVPWHVAVNWQHPEFFHFYFIEQHLLRYTTKEVGHYQPIGFFIPILIIGFFPWIVFLPQTIVQQFKTMRLNDNLQQVTLFFILWAGFIFVFFSFSKSKLIPYILPVIPPLAILTASYLTMRQKRGLQLGYGLLLLLAIAIVVVFHQVAYANLPDPQTAIFYLSIASGILLIGTLINFWWLTRTQFTDTFATTVLTTGLFLLWVLAALPFMDKRTILPLATHLNTVLTPQDEVITYNQYYQDLPFYIGRTVSILNWKNELTFGMQHQPTQTWMIDDATFWQRWHSAKRVFVIMSQEEYIQFKQRFPFTKASIIGETLTNILISNQKK